jgi:large subunit ribosomal protein L25
METYKLTATPRTVKGKQVGQLRRAGLLPGVVYGPGVEPAAVQLNTREASRILRKVHGAELIDLEMDGATRKVLVQDLQRDAIRGDFLHADFYAVDMNRTIRVRIPIRLVGTSAAVTRDSGVLVRGITELEVECLPGNLVTALEADLGALETIGKAIFVRELNVPKDIKVLTDPDDLVARVTYQAKEEDLTPVAAATTAEVEVIEKGKIEEEEGEEAAGAKGGKEAPAAKGAKEAKK